MVRRGSTVRVRQRAWRKTPDAEGFCFSEAQVRPPCTSRVNRKRQHGALVVRLGSCPAVALHVKIGKPKVSMQKDGLVRLRFPLEDA